MNCPQTYETQRGTRVDFARFATLRSSRENDCHAKPRSPQGFTLLCASAALRATIISRRDTETQRGTRVDLARFTPLRSSRETHTPLRAIVLSRQVGNQISA